MVELELTDERVHDSQKGKELIKKAKEEVEDKGKKMSKVIADAGYDTHEFFKYLGEKGCRACCTYEKGCEDMG